MKTITQETITGQVQSISTNDYLVQFVIKSIREGEVAWFDIRSNDWQAWDLKAGNQVAVTGQIVSKVWQDPFEQEEIVTLEMNAVSLKKLAA